MRMDLLEYITDAERKAALAERLGSSPGYLWQLATGWRGKKPSPDFAMRIDAATGGQVSKSTLRPDLWPATQPTPPPQAAEQKAA